MKTAADTWVALEDEESDDEEGGGEEIERGVGEEEEEDTDLNSTDSEDLREIIDHF